MIELSCRLQHSSLKTSETLFQSTIEFLKKRVPTTTSSWAVRCDIILQYHSTEACLGGTAGCVLASRLTGDSDSPVTVLLLERGPVADTWASRVPTISFGSLFNKDTLAAHWWSAPMEGADNRSLGVMYGEALGGSSRINAMIYTRGSSCEQHIQSTLCLCSSATSNHN